MTLLPPAISTAISTAVPSVTAPDRVWAAWEPAPLVVAGLVAAALVYARGLRTLRRKRGTDHGSSVADSSAPVTRGQVWAFAGSLAAFAAALASPLDSLAEGLFSAHMIQHMLLILVAAPLLVLAAPGLPLLLAVPRRARGRLARWRQHPAVRAVWRTATVPLVAWGLHVAVLWGWHLPAAYQAALANPVVHIAEHVSFVATAWLLWLVVLAHLRGRPVAGRAAAGPGWAVLLVFVTAMQGNALGAVLTLAPAPLYPEQVLGAPAWGLTALADQQLAGLIMWVPGDVLYLAVAVVLFRRWFRALERTSPSEADVTPDRRSGTHASSSRTSGPPAAHATSPTAIPDRSVS